MSTPEKPRPTLDATLALIDAVIAESNPPCLQFARQALPGEPHCAAHKRIPREMIEDLGPDALVVEPVGNTAPPVIGDYLSSLPLDVRPFPCRCVITPVEPVVRDGDTFTVTRSGVYEISAFVRPYGKPAESTPEQARSGWLARARKRLFGNDT